jgi:predicted AAA+ superfamily ATPase
MQYLSGTEPVYITKNINLLDAYQGSLAEQFVGQELLINGKGSEKNKLYYWARAKKNSSAEIDYLISRNAQILPVEVKNAPSGRLRSLHLFLKEHPETPHGITLSTSNHNGKMVDNIRFFPIYTKLL